MKPLERTPDAEAARRDPMRGEDVARSNGDRGGKRESKLWSVTFVLIVLTSFFLFVTGQGINGGLSVYVERIGGTATFAGMLSLAFSLAAAAVRILLGPIIDTRGRIIVATCGTLVLAGGIGIAWLLTDEMALTVARIVQGIGFGAATTATATAAADVLPPSRMGEGIGYFGLGQAVSMSFGPALAIAVLATDPPQNLFVLTGATALVAFALAIFCRYERRPDVLPEDAAWRVRAGAAQREADRGGADARGGECDPDATSSAGTPATEDGADPSAAHGPHAFFEPHALCGAVPLLLIGMAVGFVISFAALYGESLELGNAGLLFTVSAISMIVVRVKSKSFMDSVLPITILGVTCASGVVAFALLLASAALPPLFYLAGLFYGVFLGLGVPVCQSVAVRNSPPERWGAANALVLLANDIGIGAASLLWGALNDTVGFSASIVGGAAAIVLSYVAGRALFPEEAKTRRTVSRSI